MFDFVRCQKKTKKNFGERQSVELSCELVKRAWRVTGVSMRKEQSGTNVKHDYTRERETHVMSTGS